MRAKILTFCDNVQKYQKNTFLYEKFNLEEAALYTDLNHFSTIKKNSFLLSETHHLRRI